MAPYDYSNFKNNDINSQISWWKNSQSVGLEPTLPEGIWFLVRRLNHSATTACIIMHSITEINTCRGSYWFSNYLKICENKWILVIFKTFSNILMVVESTWHCSTTLFLSKFVHIRSTWDNLASQLIRKTGILLEIWLYIHIRGYSSVVEHPAAIRQVLGSTPSVPLRSPIKILILNHLFTNRSGFKYQKI